MSDMERRIQLERARAGSAASDERAWNDTPFTTSHVIVGSPAGAFSQFINEVLPLVPRQMWRKAFVGISPDGMTRVALGLFKNTDGDTGPGFWVARRRKQVSARCSLFFVYNHGGSYDRSGNAGPAGLRLVLLNDGRGAYWGDLESLRGLVAEAIASRQMSADSLLTLEQVYGGVSKFK